MDDLFFCSRNRLQKEAIYLTLNHLTDFYFLFYNIYIVFLLVGFLLLLFSLLSYGILFFLFSLGRKSFLPYCVYEVKHRNLKKKKKLKRRGRRGKIKIQRLLNVKYVIKCFNYLFHTATKDDVLNVL